MPRPLIQNRSSIGIRNGWSVTRVGWGDVLVHRGDQFPDTLHGFGVARECFESADPDNGGVVAREAVAVEQLADFHLDELEEFLVVHHVDLVQRDDDRRDLHLPGQQDVFAGLGHRPVGGGDHQNRTVHLGGAGDHVLDVVGVAGAVDVGVVAVLGFVLGPLRRRAGQTWAIAMAMPLAISSGRCFWFLSGSGQVGRRR